jgi:branched-chain amino acid transport system permease protein
MMTWLRVKWFYLFILIIAVAVPFCVPNRYFFQIIIMSCLFAIGALSMNLILGYTGQASLAHGAFFGIGAYGVGILTQTFEFSFWLALPLAAMIAALIGLIVGVPALRTKGSYFAIATMCLGEIIVLIAGNWIELTGGNNGIVGINPPTAIPLPVIGEISFQSQTAQYYLVLAFLLLTIFIMRRLIYSLKGLTFMATRNNEVLAEAVGINTANTKLLSFVVGNFFAGMAGGIYASLIGSISPSVASIAMTFNFLLYVLLGGMATIAGPILGGFALPVLMEYLQFLQDYQMIFFGVMLIVVITYFPRGLMGAIMNLRAKFKRKKTEAQSAPKG